MTQIKYLTRIEAITAMVAGHKVTHLYFFEDEWVKYHGNDSYQFDDGVICGMYDMWKNRSGGNWETGWSIVEESVENKEVLTEGKEAISGEADDLAKETIQNALYATGRLQTWDCEEVCDGILLYLKDAGLQIVKLQSTNTL